MRIILENGDKVLINGKWETVSHTNDGDKIVIFYSGDPIPQDKIYLCGSFAKSAPQWLVSIDSPELPSGIYKEMWLEVK